ncbi:Carboxylic ester hydrolase [Mycena sanguinolenta]|uniref:Carboxylic ester hydrolase n=1 Tax=Mycena sanguinolenta TaxID=230812 RepID=A0A8H6YRS0_9AGAR|nr:Carboxylic ester hydrolase [Mycena sanguinolenta]
MDVGFNLRFLSKLISSSFLLLFASNYAEQHPAKCLALKSSLNLENTTILDVEYVLGRTTVNTPGACLGDKQHVSSPLCRVQFSTQTSPTSAIRAEAWLPDEWYGRFLGIGNAGLDGCILYNELNYGSSMHFATVGSNNGHDGYTGLPFLGNPEVLNDFAFRSIHAEAVIGKQIVETYYGKSHTKAYYLGCATGGRQGTLSALRYPEDFDGILAGSPATDFNRLLHWMGMVARAIGAPNAAEAPAPEFIPPSLWRVVAEEVLAQCDTLDGVHDGIITEPDGCDFRPEALACDGGRTERCLTPPQVEALHKIYAPLYDNGELVYPRFDPGSERGFGGIILFTGNFPYITQDWLKYAVLNVTDFDFTTYGLAEGRLMDAINPGGIATFDGDMSAFRDRGGKFLTYHGRADPVRTALFPSARLSPFRTVSAKKIDLLSQGIPSGNSKRMYSLLAQTLGTPSLDAFYRLFLVPGMATCDSGLFGAAYKFGQLGYTNARNASSHNVLLALVDWVEGDVAPESIIGTSENWEEREHCRYPMRSVWDGERFGCQR